MTFWKRIPHAKWSDHKRENTPLKPSSRAPLYSSGRHIDDDLDTICLKALAAERDRRYESVSQLATDLTYWLRGDPIQAKPPSLTYRLRKLANRYRWQSATLIVSLVACVVAALLGITLAIRERKHSTKLAIERSAAIDAKLMANELRELAIHERIVAQHSAYASSIRLATMQLESNQPYLAEQILNETQTSLRGWEWTYLHAQLPQAELSMATGLNRPTSLAISHNHNFAVVSDGHRLSRLDLQSAQHSMPYEVNGKVQRVAITDDGLFVAALIHEKAPVVRVYQFQATDTFSSSPQLSALQLTEVWSLEVNRDSALAWEHGLRDPALIVMEGNGPKPEPWSLHKLKRASGESLCNTSLKRWKLSNKDLVVGKTLAIVRCSSDRLAVVRLSNLSIAGYIYGGPDNRIEDFEFNSAEDGVVYCRGRGMVESPWDQADKDVEELDPNQTINARLIVDKPFVEIYRLNRTSDDKWTAITDTHCIVEQSEAVLHPIKNESKTVSLLDGRYATILQHGLFEIRRELLESKSSRFSSRSVAPNPEGRRVVVHPSSEFCLYQNWSRENVYYCSLKDQSEPYGLATAGNRKVEWSRLPIFHPDGTAIIGTTPTQTEGNEKSELMALRWGEENSDPTPLPINSTAWSAAPSIDGKKLFVGTVQGVAVIDWSSRKRIQDWGLENGPFIVMPMSDNTGLFAMGVDHVVHQLNFESQQTRSSSIMEKAKGLKPADSDYFAEDHLLAISETPEVHIFRLGDSHQKIATIPVEAKATAIRFSPDGKRLAIAMSNRKIAIWDWLGMHRLLDLSTRGACSSMDFSRDGRWLVNTDFGPCLTIR
ncbi:MAG: hypothetical protein U0930_02290 [Pirellulales bacterium]